MAPGASRCVLFATVVILAPACSKTELPGGQPPTTCDAACQLSCGGKLTQCDQLCVDTLHDPSNCGGCAISCSAGLISEKGDCACPDGFTACAGDPISCVDTVHDSDHCGSCGHACDPGRFCSDGVCTFTCGENLTRCDQTGASYCAATASDPKNCGGRGNVCGPEYVCSDGVWSFLCPNSLTTCESDSAAT